MTLTASEEAQVRARAKELEIETEAQALEDERMGAWRRANGFGVGAPTTEYAPRVERTGWKRILFGRGYEGFNW